MFNRAVLLWIVTVFVQTVKPHNTQNGNATITGGLDLVISKIESRLSIASRMIDTAKRELRNDLEQLCRNGSCNGSVSWKRSYSDGKPMDCGDIYNDGFNTNGIYEIWPRSRIFNGPLLIYCDMEDGGGWTVIQRRGDFGNPIDYFFQDWNTYKTGFGHLLREFWIGNDNLFILTGQRSYELKVDLKDWDDALLYAKYAVFWVDDEVHNYTLHIGTYEGTAGDSLQRQNGSQFSTRDRDNDLNRDAHCANSFKGAWWYQACMDSNLNGHYIRYVNGNAAPYGEGVVWKTIKGFTYSLKDTVMKIRASSFRNSVNNIVN